MNETGRLKFKDIIKNIGAQSIIASLLVFILTIAATCVGSFLLYKSTKESLELQGRVNAVQAAKEYDKYLIAEDQEMNAEVLSDLLELEDMTSMWAQNGQIAVKMFAESEVNSFDAILMDMRMPVMDGLSATREIRKLDRPDGKSIPIIALTANAFEEDVQRCLEAGMNEHLSKPVDIDALINTLSRLITNK